MVKEFKPNLIMHFPCMLSGSAEKDVFKSLEINLDSI